MALYREFENQEQIDAQYNASRTVADAAAELKHYVDQSQHARKSLRCTLDISFGPTLAETLDIFPAEGRPQADDIRRPPPGGVEQSGKATFTQEYEAQTARFRAIAKDIKLEAQ